MIEFAPKVSGVFAARYDDLLDALSELVNEYEPQLETPASRAALAVLDAEQDNLIAVLRDVLEESAEASKKQLIAAKRLYLRLGRYLSMRGFWKEKQQWGMALLLRLGRGTSGLFNSIGNATGDLGDHEAAVGFYELAIKSLGVDGDDLRLSASFANLAGSYFRLGRLDEALDYAERALAMERAKGDLHAVAMSLMNIAAMRYERWEMAEVLALTREALDIVEELGDVHLQAQFTSNLALNMVANLMFDEAVPVYERALELLAEIEDEIGLAWSEYNFALLCRLLKDTTRARQLALSSLGRFERYQMADTKKARDLLDQLGDVS